MSKENGISSIVGGIILFFSRHLPLDINGTSLAEAAKKCSSSFGKLVNNCELVSDINIVLIVISILLILFGLYKLYEPDKSPKNEREIETKVKHIIKSKEKNLFKKLSFIELLGYLLVIITFFQIPSAFGFWDYFILIVLEILGFGIVYFARKKKRKLGLFN